MPTLHWIGKDKVINHHLDVPFKVIEKIYDFGITIDENGNPLQENLRFTNDDLRLVEDENHQSKIKNRKSGNMIIHGDNLEALKALLPEYEGKVKCIYIDPPYNTGNESWVYNDNVNDPKIKKWLGQVVGKEAEDLTRHDKWLCMMYPRLKLLHKLLADDGAIFISIDDNEQANLKLVCDEIFGGGNFVAQFLWKKKGTSTNVTGAIVSPQTEYITCYSKSRVALKPRSKSSSDRKYPLSDEKGNYRTTIIEKRNDGEYLRETMVFEILGQKPREGKRWQIGLLKARELESKNRFIVENKTVKLKVYDFEDKDTTSAQPTLLLEHGSSEEARKILKDFHLDFSTPKPNNLIEHLIDISTNKNSIILDSFSGSGTTAHAVLNLNKQDGGNRKFILVEMEDYAETITAERVKRVMKKMMNDELGMMNEKSQEIHNSSFITHNYKFDFYELGQPLFLEDGNLNEMVGVEKIRQYIYYTETQSNYELRVMNDELKGIHNSSFIDHHSFMGVANDTAYYFHYLPNEVTSLDHAFLATMKTKAEQYVIYADNCLLTKEFMTKHHIIFKKIPRDITKF